MKPTDPLSLEDWFWYWLCYVQDSSDVQAYAEKMAEQFREDLKEGKVEI